MAADSAPGPVELLRYDVDADAVAAAIVDRLIAGRALRPAPGRRRGT